MQAIVCENFNKSSIEEIFRPNPASDEVLIEVLRVQLSVTECRLYRGEDVAHKEAVASRIADDARLFGHEFCGRIVEVGDDVSKFSVGDRVYAPGKIPCLACPTCEANHEHFCQNKSNIGYERPGALAEYFTVPAYPLEKVPDNLSNAEVAAMQPFASSVLATHDAEIKTGDVVAVIGLGVMGSQCAQLAQYQGAARVFGTDVVEEKLDIAASYGIETVDGRSENMKDRILESTDGSGADVVIEAVGGRQDQMTDGSDPIAQGFNLLRKGGTILQVGHITGDISATARSLRSKSMTWRHPRVGNPKLGPNSTPGTVAPRLVSSGQITISDHITHELEGLDSFEKVVDITLNKEDNDSLGPAQIVM